MSERHIVPADEPGFHVLTDLWHCPCCPTAYKERVDGIMVLTVEHHPLARRRFMAVM